MKKLFSKILGLNKYFVTYDWIYRNEVMEDTIESDKPLNVCVSGDSFAVYKRADNSCVGYARNIRTVKTDTKGSHILVQEVTEDHDNEVESDY